MPFDGINVAHPATARAREDRPEQTCRAWYKSPVWKAIKRHRLLREPNCRQCASEGRLGLATCVGHVMPHRGQWSRFMDYANTQSLCAPDITRRRNELDRQRPAYRVLRDVSSTCGAVPLSRLHAVSLRIYIIHQRVVFGIGSRKVTSEYRVWGLIGQKCTCRELGHLRKQLAESGLAEHNGVRQDLVDRNPTPTTLSEPPGF